MSTERFHRHYHYTTVLNLVRYCTLQYYYAINACRTPPPYLYPPWSVTVTRATAPHGSGSGRRPRSCSSQNKVADGLLWYPVRSFADHDTLGANISRFLHKRQCEIGVEWSALRVGQSSYSALRMPFLCTIAPFTPLSLVFSDNKDFVWYTAYGKTSRKTSAFSF